MHFLKLLDLCVITSNKMLNDVVFIKSFCIHIQKKVKLYTTVMPIVWTLLKGGVRQITCRTEKNSVHR